MPRSLFALLYPALLLLGACDFDVAGSAHMDAPVVYREWWSRTEECSGLSGDFDRVEWLVVPGHSFECSSGQCAGHWRRGHQIYLADGWKMNEMVVRHEILHELMNGGGHPNPPFGQGCPLTWETWPAGAEPRVTATTRPHLD
ncbi:MAG: hypothetical protein H0T68_04600 [Gemmatimonadales bacterium]|nr:hypothetical protein [Gemmatimonadales bacterium]